MPAGCIIKNNCRGNRTHLLSISALTSLFKICRRVRRGLIKMEMEGGERGYFADIADPIGPGFDPVRREGTARYYDDVAAAICKALFSGIISTTG